MFSKVIALDKTKLMIDIMKMELGKFHKIKETFVEEFSQEDFDYIDQVDIPFIHSKLN